MTPERVRLAKGPGSRSGRLERRADRNGGRRTGRRAGRTPAGSPDTGGCGDLVRLAGPAFLPLGFIARFPPLAR